MRTSRCCASLALALALFAATPVLARGQERADFRHHYDRALALYRAADYAAAIVAFQRAYALRQLPRLLLNLGQAHRKLGHAQEALDCYRLYLRAEPAPPPEVKADLDGFIAQTQALLDAAARLQPAGEGGSRPPASGGASPPSSAPVLGTSPPGRAPAPDSSSSSPGALPLPSALRPQAPPWTARSAPPRAAAPPLHRRWWFWTTLGVVAAGTAAGITAGVLLTQPGPPPGIDIRDVRF